MIRRGWVGAVLLATFLMASLMASLGTHTPAHGHALQPGYLDLRPLQGDVFEVFWKVPAVGERAMAITAVLPDSCSPRQPEALAWTGSAYVSRWIASCPGGLAGGTFRIDGLERTATDVLLRYELDSAGAQSQRLTPDAPSFTVPREPDSLAVVRTYFLLGVEHILLGPDHLLFVFALLLLIRDRWKLVGAITAFTVAHSITLAAATLGHVELPGPPVEAVIALSILFLASELAKGHPDATRFSERYPASVAFAFGLLHGFGFAGALAETGLPRGDIPTALLTFNLGVEAGQLLFIAGCLAAGWLLSRLRAQGAPHHLDRFRATRIASYAIGGLAAFWLVERVAGFS